MDIVPCFVFIFTNFLLDIFIQYPALKTSKVVNNGFKSKKESFTTLLIVVGVPGFEPGASNAPC